MDPHRYARALDMTSSTAVGLCEQMAKGYATRTCESAATMTHGIILHDFICRNTKTIDDRWSVMCDLWSVIGDRSSATSDRRISATRDQRSVITDHPVTRLLFDEMTRLSDAGPLSATGLIA